MQLHGTPLSHFTRKIRVLLAELGLPFDFVRPPGVLVAGTAAYGDNPLRRVPTLVDRDARVFDSDHIARYLVTRYDPADRFGVLSTAPDDLNRLAAINGIMANEVTLILVHRDGVANVTSIGYFRKLLDATATALAWLDARTTSSESLDYRDIALVCMWQHLEYYALLPLGAYTRLAQRVDALGARPAFATTTPEVSLVDARAAGWSPG